MALQKSSQTAEAALAVRAFGTNSPDTTLIDDPLAEKLIRGFYAFIGGGNWRRWLFVEQMYNRLMPGMIGVPLVRMRYTEDCLARYLAKDGVYLILGAGMNTYAWRQNQHKVIEIDHPLTQQEKQKRFTESGLTMPKHVQFLPVDFANAELEPALNSHVHNSQKYFVSWNGVTYYLNKKDTEATLTALATTLPKGTFIVFDYMDEEAFVPEKQTATIKRIFRAVARRGEPFISGFSASGMEVMLQQCGLELVEHRSGTAIADDYSEQVGKYPPFPFIHYLTAKVK